MDFEAVVRGAGGFDRPQPGEAADAVIDMDDKIAGGKARHLGDEIFRALGGTPRANEPLAENVLFGDQRDVGGFETGIQPKHRQTDLHLRQSERLRS